MRGVGKGGDRQMGKNEEGKRESSCAGALSLDLDS